MKYTTSTVNDIPALKLKQLNYESDVWKRSLVFLTEENVHLKNKLAEVLKDGIHDDLLNEIEAFQNEFINEDEIIRQLISDIADLDNLLIRKMVEDGRLMKEIKEKFKKLRTEMIKVENHFVKLKHEFSDYLSENI